MLQDADVVVGFARSSWLLIQRCQDLGKPFVLVQTREHPATRLRIQRELSNRFPEWHDYESETLPEVRAIEYLELDTAALVVTKSSSLRESLLEHGVDAKRINLVPEAIDCRDLQVARTQGPRPFRFIYSGQFDGPAGLPLLLEAWGRLKLPNAELWLVGDASHSVTLRLSSQPGLRLLSAVSESKIQELLNQSDVFVFPSLLGDSGNEILRAMACGLPVITTTATPGIDFLKQASNGWIHNAGDLDALCSDMESAYRSPSVCREMGLRARARAEELNWTGHGDQWSKLLHEFSRKPIRSIESKPYPPRVLVAHPGTQYSRHLARQLSQFGMLKEFHTSIAYTSDGATARTIGFLSKKWSRRLANRLVPGVPARQLITQPTTELRALIQQRLGAEEGVAILRRNQAFQESIPEQSLQGANVVIGFDTSSWILCRRTQRLDGRFILDQSIAHPRSYQAVLAELQKRYPMWGSVTNRKSNEQLVHETAEHDQADRIVVPSTFVARTLVEHGVDPAKIRKNPFGCDLELFQPGSPTPIRPLRFIFAGSLQARKGLPLLLEAWRRIGGLRAIELWIAGGGTIPEAERENLPPNIRWLGRLNQAQLVSAFQQCHVFIFPSLFEGLAQVQIEAAASGLPVIGTTNSGADAVIENGKTGYILPAGDLSALVQTLENIATNPSQISQMRQQILEHRYLLSWDLYGERWSRIIREVVAELPQSVN